MKVVFSVRSPSTRFFIVLVERGLTARMMEEGSSPELYIQLYDVPRLSEEATKAFRKLYLFMGKAHHRNNTSIVLDYLKANGKTPRVKSFPRGSRVFNVMEESWR